MIRLGVFLLSLDVMLVHRRVTTQQYIRRYLTEHLGGETRYPVLQLLYTRATEFKLANYFRREELNTFPYEDIAGSVWCPRMSLVVTQSLKR